MIEKRIKLKSMNDVREFIKAAATCSCDVDVRYNHLFLDGKSLLGIASAMTNELVVDCEEPSEAFSAVVNQYVVV